MQFQNYVTTRDWMRQQRGANAAAERPSPMAKKANINVSKLQTILKQRESAGARAKAAFKVVTACEDQLLDMVGRRRVVDLGDGRVLRVLDNFRGSNTAFRAVRIQRFSFSVENKE